MKHLATRLGALLALASPALGNPTAVVLNGGTMDFDYLEVPPGSINGSFTSNGIIVDAPPVEGTAAATFELDGSHYAVVVGALEDGANFVDGGVIVVADAAPIAPGNYPLNGVDGVFVFVDDAIGWVPPTDFCATNWTQELGSIVSSGKYLSMSGSVTFVTVSPTVIAGTFECLTVDGATGVVLAVSSGSFNIDTTTSVESSTFAKVKALYR